MKNLQNSKTVAVDLVNEKIESTVVDNITLSTDYMKYNRLDELSEQFFRVVDPQINVSELKVELDKEIYRFNNYLEIIKEGL
jgi:uncharacterized FlgJ-related protein